VQVLGQVVLQRAARKHADAAKAIAMWRVSATAAKWSSLVELRTDIPSADYVRPFTVFNIRGNAYRLITVVEYAEQVVVVRDFLTHAEYDKGAWK
jgi:mRNA interferase HigB